ncbi:MAG: hypothetical protein HY909_21485 [Deltaproteobacteria bacterium]|nr:hypothetical protein [Deltaproteobacteria bacterium]
MKRPSVLRGWPQAAVALLAAVACGSPTPDGALSPLPGGDAGGTADTGAMTPPQDSGQPTADAAPMADTTPAADTAPPQDADPGYPPGPYGGRVGNTLPNFTYQGFWNPTAVMGLARDTEAGITEVTFDMVRRSGARFALIQLGAYW